MQRIANIIEKKRCKRIIAYFGRLQYIISRRTVRLEVKGRLDLRTVVGQDWHTV